MDILKINACNAIFDIKNFINKQISTVPVKIEIKSDIEVEQWIVHRKTTYS